MKRGEENTDYVNASFIDVSLLQSSFHPLPMETTSHCFLWEEFIPNTPCMGFVQPLPRDFALGHCWFLPPRNPQVYPAPCGRGELEPEQSLQILASLLPLWPLLMAVEKGSTYPWKLHSTGHLVRKHPPDEIREQYTIPKPWRGARSIPLHLSGWWQEVRQGG